MATLNTSSNGPSIARSYRSVVDAPAPTGAAASSPTYGQWAVFSVSTPLVSAFQQSSVNKESVLKVQSSGEGELEDLIEEFSDGRIQFAFVKVKDPNTGLPKNVLIAWCGEGVPERTKGYFTSHLAAVSQILHGYHVQITARSDRDLTPEGIIQKVADSSGSKYSAGTVPPPSAAPKPSVASKPVFTPSRTVGSVQRSPNPRQTSGPKRDEVDDDGWGPDAPPVTRTQLEKVKPAYQPTKVNIHELRSQKDATVSSVGSQEASRPDVVKGGYQPVGKVDIAEIRRQARESGQVVDERPEPVKGAYEPVGKVDIAAIRAKAQGSTPESTVSPPRGISPAVTGGSGGGDEPKSLAERSAVFKASERLTTLPKPKVTNKWSASTTFTGTKAPLPGSFEAKPLQPTPTVGSASRTFADEGGKTPAQIWAEKKAKERGGLPTPTPPQEPQPLQSQTSGGWKSSYTGKTWAPVQTTHTGTSSRSAGVQEDRVEEAPSQSEEVQPGKVSAIRAQFAGAAPMRAPAESAGLERGAPPPPPPAPATAAAEPVESPAPHLPVRPRVQDDIPAEQHQDIPPPPPQPRSPTPEPSSPVPTGSPIRIAMPVAKGSTDDHVADAHQEQFTPPPALPVDSLSHVVPREEEIEEPAHDPARDVSQAAGTVTSRAVAPSPPPAQPEPELQTAPTGGSGIRALVMYDYDKSADDELEIREGEYVTNIDMVDDDWWMGVNARGEQGLFPSNYVEIVKNSEEGQAAHHAEEAEEQHHAPLAATGGRPTATALYDYEAAEDNEIEFPEGAKITNIEFAGEHWWLGEYNGKTGLFPSNYVQLDE
ncbi:hypothetical protein VTO42DRAFT_6498 [Malbranchea cinnamomea]